MNQRAPNDDLPITAFLVLGILASYDEELTAGEIKTRAEFSVGHFFWSPSVSHIRRELSKLLDRELVSQRTIQNTKRPMTLFQATPLGEQILRRWVRSYPGSDQVVTKNPVILKTWLAVEEDTEQVLQALDEHLAGTRRRLDDVLWAQRRSEEIGVNDDPQLRFGRAVLNYSTRALYAEISNITQLRDELSRGTDSDPVARVDRPKGTLRRRH